MNNFNFYSPTEFVFGKGRAAEAGYFVKAIPHRAGGADTQSDFSCKMTENMHVDVLASRQAGLVRCCLKKYGGTRAC